MRPKDAATLILIDRSGAEPKVLLGKRHARHKFMPGKFVFPGGGIEPADKHMPVARDARPQAEARLMQRCPAASPVRARALALAAIRETCEETGLLLGTRARGRRSMPAGPWAAFAQHGVLPDLARHPFHRPRHHAARPAAPLRRALLHRGRERDRAPHRRRHGPDAELVELVWMPIDGGRSSSTCRRSPA